MTIYDKIARNARTKGRVRISYKVEDEGAVPAKELPFIVGVMGDYTGNNPSKKPESLAKRKFIQIDRFNFDEVMERMSPGLRFNVKNTMAEGEDKEMSVELKFNSMSDFEPAAIIEQVEPLKELYDARNKLRDLIGDVDRSEELEDLLAATIQNTEQDDSSGDTEPTDNEGEDS